jgi:hypothetical protein
VTHTYEHTFKNGVKASATVDDKPLGLTVEWYGTPTRALLAEYFQWREKIFADFAERTGKKILVVNLT